MNVLILTKKLFFIVWTVCLTQLNTTAKAEDIISKSLLITATAQAIGLSTVSWTVGEVRVVINFSVRGLKGEQTLYIAR